MIYGFLIIFICYACFTLALRYYWIAIPSFFPKKDDASESELLFSILIPIRNEAQNILDLLKDLEQQDYPKNLYEVIVIDDNSSDNSSQIVQEFKATFNLKVEPLKYKEGIAHKKSAIRQGIEVAMGYIIVTTDGDCRVGSLWLRTIASFYQVHKSKLMFGGVSFYKESSLFEKAQTVEFASLTGSGAACLAAGFPNMCNGANLAYEKSAFYEVNGYEGYDHIPSGDDEFLMHKIYNLHPGKVHFIKSQEMVVLTKAQKSFASFFNQRKRWAGKWKYYQFNNIRYIAFFVFISNVSLLISIVLLASGKLGWLVLATIYLLKFVPDWLFLKEVLRFYNKKNNPFIFLLTALFYPLYVSFFGISSNIGKYTWKERNF